MGGGPPLGATTAMEEGNPGGRGRSAARVLARDGSVKGQSDGKPGGGVAPARDERDRAGYGRSWKMSPRPSSRRSGSSAPRRDGAPRTPPAEEKVWSTCAGSSRPTVPALGDVPPFADGPDFPGAPRAATRYASAAPDSLPRPDAPGPGFPRLRLEGAGGAVGAAMWRIDPNSPSFSPLMPAAKNSTFLPPVTPLPKAMAQRRSNATGLPSA